MKETYFILETDKNEDFIDTFVYDTFKSIKDFNSFKNNEKYYGYRTNISVLNQFGKDLIPVGSIEFVHNYFSRHNITIPKPLNVPDILREYCSREIIDINKKELLSNKIKYNNYFIKSNDSYKDFEINKVKYFNFDSSKTENYFISSQIEPEIISEYRCFVLGNRLLSINNYIGDPIGLTNLHINMLKLFISKIDLRAFTIDIAVLENGNIEIIELHHGYSCGNYGFKGDYYLSFLINGINQLK
jgi:hypothetical protein